MEFLKVKLQGIYRISVTKFLLRSRFTLNPDINISRKFVKKKESTILHNNYCESVVSSPIGTKKKSNANHVKLPFSPIFAEY